VPFTGTSIPEIELNDCNGSTSWKSGLGRSAPQRRWLNSAMGDGELIKRKAGQSGPINRERQAEPWEPMIDTLARLRPTGWFWLGTGVVIVKLSPHSWHSSCKVQWSIWSDPFGNFYCHCPSSSVSGRGAEYCSPRQTIRLTPPFIYPNSLLDTERSLMFWAEGHRSISRQNWDGVFGTNASHSNEVHEKNALNLKKYVFFSQSTYSRCKVVTLQFWNPRPQITWFSN